MGDVVAFINLRIGLSQDPRDRRSGDAQVAGGLRQVAEAGHKSRAVRVVLHDRPPLQTADDHVVERPGGVEPSLAGHA